MIQPSYIGNDSINQLADILDRLSAKRLFIVRAKASYVTTGARDIINTIVDKAKISTVEFFDFEENPKYEDMLKGIEILKDSVADIILAVGGGSVLDMAKLIRFFYAYEGDVTGKVFVANNNPLLPLVVLPTTAGTGAEATHFSVLYKNKIKFSVEHDDMLPDYAIVYPPFTYNNPIYLTACTGFDALAQSVEAYWNLNATNESDMYAEKAIKLLWNNLPLLVNTPTNELRDKILEGAYWAGKAINITKTTAPHAFSYPFTTYYHYPHGHAVAITFPYFMYLNCVYNNDKERVSKLLDMLGITAEYDLKYKLCRYVENIGLSVRPEDVIDWDFVINQVNLERLKNNPVEVDKDELKKYLLELKQCK